MIGDDLLPIHTFTLDKIHGVWCSWSSGKKIIQSIKMKWASLSVVTESLCWTHIFSVLRLFQRARTSTDSNIPFRKKKPLFLQSSSSQDEKLEGLWYQTKIKPWGFIGVRDEREILGDFLWYISLAFVNYKKRSS